MKGQISLDSEVGVPASVVWKTYGTLELAKLVVKLLPNIFQEIIVEEGDGGEGTVLDIKFAPDLPGLGFSVYKEKFTKVDDENRVKETEVVEGTGYLSLGFLLYRIRLEILEKDADSTIIRSTVEYELAEESAANASLASADTLAFIAQVVGNHLVEEYKSKVATA